MCSGAALSIQAPMMATIFFTACALKVWVLEMTFTSKPHLSSPSPKMFHAAAAGPEADMRIDVVAVWCQPALRCCLAPAFLRSDVMKVVLDLSVPNWLLWMPVSAVAGSVISYLISGVFSPFWCRAILSILVISLSSLVCADRSVTLFLEKPYVCYGPVAGILLFEKAVTFWTWSVSVTWNNNKVVHKFSLTHWCERTHGKITGTCFSLIKKRPKLQKTIN